jgi:hypothetical protein
VSIGNSDNVALLDINTADSHSSSASFYGYVLGSYDSENRGFSIDSKLKLKPHLSAADRGKPLLAVGPKITSRTDDGEDEQDKRSLTVYDEFVRVNDLEANKLNSNVIDSAVLKAENVEIGNLNVTNLKSENVEIGNLNVTNLRTENITFTNVIIENPDLEYFIFEKDELSTKTHNITIFSDLLYLKHSNSTTLIELNDLSATFEVPINTKRINVVDNSDENIIILSETNAAFNVPINIVKDDETNAIILNDLNATFNVPVNTKEINVVNDSNENTIILNGTNAAFNVPISVNISSSEKETLSIFSVENENIMNIFKINETKTIFYNESIIIDHVTEEVSFKKKLSVVYENHVVFHQNYFRESLGYPKNGDISVENPFQIVLLDLVNETMEYVFEYIIIIGKNNKNVNGGYVGVFYETGWKYTSDIVRGISVNVICTDHSLTKEDCTCPEKSIALIVNTGNHEYGVENNFEDDKIKLVLTVYAIPIDSENSVDPKIPGAFVPETIASSEVQLTDVVCGEPQSGW